MRRSSIITNRARKQFQKIFDGASDCSREPGDILIEEGTPEPIRRFFVALCNLIPCNNPVKISGDLEGLKRHPKFAEICPHDPVTVLACCQRAQNDQPGSEIYVNFDSKSLLSEIVHEYYHSLQYEYILDLHAPEVEDPAYVFEDIFALAARSRHSRYFRDTSIAANRIRHEMRVLVAKVRHNASLCAEQMRELDV